MSEPVEFQAGAEGIAWLWLNRPQRRNALNRELAGALGAAFAHAAAGGARVVVLGARTDGRTWAAGQDIAELALDGSDPEAWDAPMRALVRAVQAVPVPVIAAVDGGVWGGACELVLACDFCVATPASTLALTPALVGVPYSVTGLANLRGRLGPGLLREMLFTGRPIEMQRALAAGVVNHCVGQAELEAFVADMAAAIAANAPAGIRALKASLQALETGPALAPAEAERVAALRRDAWRSEDYREGIAAFTEKRKPRFEGR